jgi:hypothetical protein
VPFTGGARGTSELPFLQDSNQSAKGRSC